MQLNKINFSSLTTVKETRDRSLYSDDNFFYKLWTHRTGPFIIQDGLNLMWQGFNQIASYKVGLVNAQTCPALYDFIYDNDFCIGYITHRGTPVNDYNEFTLFVDKLVHQSIVCQYGYVDVNINNVIIYQNQISMIDFDFAPIKLDHCYHLTPAEFEFWKARFAITDSSYTDLLFKLLKL